MKVDPKWIKDISGVNIPNGILNFLALGPKFSIKPVVVKDISIKKFYILYSILLTISSLLLTIPCRKKLLQPNVLT